MRHRTTTLFPRTLATTFALLGAACSVSASSMGTFKVNGKDAPLNSAVLVGMPPSGTTPRMVLVLSEKVPQPGSDPNAVMMSDPKAYGATVSAVLLKIDGGEWSDTTGCMIAHPATTNRHGNYLDATSCKLTDVAVANGRLHGHLASMPSAKDGNDAIEIDVRLDVKMP